MLFEFSKRHNRQAVDEVLGDYEGYLMADAHAVYDHLYVDGSVTEVNCWAHARRYFFKAMSSDPELAREALAMIRAFPLLPRSLAEAPRKMRAKESKPQIASSPGAKRIATASSTTPRSRRASTTL